MKLMPLLVALCCFACVLLPSPAAGALLVLPPRAEETSLSPEDQLYGDACELRSACCVLRWCMALPGLEEMVEAVRSSAQKSIQACREQMQACLPEGGDPDVAEVLEDCEELLREGGREVVDPFGVSVEHGLELMLPLVPEDAEGEPWLTARKAAARLQAARDALFEAFAEQEFRVVAQTGEPTVEQLHELLRLTADFRREMQRWGRRSLTEARLQAWQEDGLMTRGPTATGYYEKPGWIAYLRADAEGAWADYERMQRRLRCRAAAVIRHQLRYGKVNAEALAPTDAAWRMGDAMPAGVQGEAATFYRLRDAVGFALMVQPVVGQPRAEQVLAALAEAGELRVLEAALRPHDEAGHLNTYFVLHSYARRWPGEESLVKGGMFHRAGVDVLELTAPAAGGAAGRARVETQAARLRARLDAAEARLPHLPDAPDAACRRLLVDVVAHWNAYVYALRRWGYLTQHRGFVWGGGCLGYWPIRVWGEDFYIDFRYPAPELGLSAREGLRGLVAAMRRELEESYAEHMEGDCDTLAPAVSAPLKLVLPATLDGQPPLPEAEPSGNEVDWEKLSL